MRVRRHIPALVCGAVLLGTVLAPAEALAQGFIGVRVARAPVFYDPWYGYGYPRYPRFYAQRPYYGYYGYSGSLRLQVTPRDAEVFIDGYFVGTVDDYDGVFQRLRLEPGEHDLELYMPGYRSVREQIFLQPGKTSRLRLALEPLGPGEPAPVRPSAPAVVSAPGATGVVSGPGAAGVRRTGPPPPRRGPAGRDAAELVARTGEYGSLSVRVQPGDAMVLIDGERWEGSTSDAERLVVQLAAGRHVVEIQKDGYRRYVTELTVRPGETTTLNVSLNENQP